MISWAFYMTREHDRLDKFGQLKVGLATSGKGKKCPRCGRQVTHLLTVRRGGAKERACTRCITGKDPE